MSGRTDSTYSILLIATSLAAIVATYLLSTSSLEIGAKTRGFSAIIAAFLVACVFLRAWQSRRKVAGPGEIPEYSDDNNIDRGLSALDEANEIFTGALKSADTFRLVASRVKGLVPFRSIVLMLLDQTRSHLSVAEAVGMGIGEHKGRIVDFDDGLAARSYKSGQIEFGDEALSVNEHAAPSVAIPLIRGVEVFGVLQLYFDRTYETDEAVKTIYEGIGTRVAPLIMSSIALERSQTNALTDATTDLPNERAFYLILENQIAEAMRKRDDRPVTILAMDIKGFDDINHSFGHAAGDRTLNFVAQTIKNNLRQMDFFARSMGDEFLAILPTASKEISPEVIARIHAGFFGRKLKITDTDSIDIHLNFGWAAFGEDGETADRLLGIARLRKEQSKTGATNTVIWFPQEFAN